MDFHLRVVFGRTTIPLRCRPVSGKGELGPGQRSGTSGNRQVAIGILSPARSAGAGGAHPKAAEGCRSPKASPFPLAFGRTRQRFGLRQSSGAFPRTHPWVRPPRCSGHRPTFVRTSRPRSCRERGRLARSPTAPQGSNRLRGSGRHGAIAASRGTDPGQAPWNAECGVRNAEWADARKAPKAKVPSSKEAPSRVTQRSPRVDRVVRTGGNRSRIVGRGWSRRAERGSVTRSNVATRKAMDCPPIDALINLGSRSEL